MKNIRLAAPDDKLIAAKMTVRVKKPSLPAVPNSTKFSKQIRNDILRDEFGYNESEIARFNLEYPNSWVIEDNKYPNKWATDEQIKNAAVEKDGLIALVLTEPWVKTVRDFRSLIILNALSFAVGAISDSSLQRKLTEDLNTILNASGDDRLKALRGLLSSASGDPTARPEITAALSYLAAQGYQDNPFLLLARARISLDGNRNAGVSTLLSAAVKNTYHQFSSSKNPVLNLTGTEAAYIN